MCILFFNSIRQNIKSIAYDFKDSIVVLACIFIYIGYFAIIGYFILEGTFQGFADFDSLGDTYFALTILITTSNFPDVMLFAYNTSTWYTIYFIIFVIFGVFFLMNVLLGVIFDNYKRRVEWASKNRSKERMKHIEKFFDFYDDGEKSVKGYLTIPEAKAFFAHVLDLKYKSKTARLKFRSIVSLADPEGEKILHKHRVLEFFRMGGFLHLEELS